MSGTFRPRGTRSGSARSRVRRRRGLFPWPAATGVHPGGTVEGSEPAGTGQALGGQPLDHPTGGPVESRKGKFHLTQLRSHGYATCYLAACRPVPAGTSSPKSPNSSRAVRTLAKSMDTSSTNSSNSSCFCSSIRSMRSSIVSAHAYLKT